MKFGLTKNAVWALILVVSSFVIYGVALKNPYYFDDQITIELNHDLESSSPPLRFYKSVLINQEYQFRGYRPTLMMSYWANIRLLGKSPEAIRFGNILLHTANALLWVFILLALSQAPWMKLVAWGSGFAFLLHPIQTLGINFLWKRSSILESLFILAALYVHVRERNRGRNYRTGMVLAQIFLFLCAVTTKESGIILPVVIFLTDICFYRSLFMDHWRGSVRLYLFFGMEMIAYYFFRTHWLQGIINAQIFRSHAENFRSLTSMDYFLESLSTLARYFKLWVFPQPLLFDDPNHFESGWKFRIFVTVTLWIGSIYAALRFRKNPFIAFFLGLLWVSFIPTSSFFAIQFSMDQIRMYLALAGLSGLLMMVLLKIQERTRFKNLFAISFSMLMLFYFVTTFLQNMRYSHPIRILQDVTDAYPKSGKAWDNLAIAYLNSKMYPEMLDAYRTAATVEPRPNSKLRYKMWDALFLTDETSRNQALLRIDVSDVDSIPMMNLIENELAVAAYGPASQHLEIARKRFPTYARVHLKSGELWEKTGDIENARKAYANVLAMDPYNKEAQVAQQRIGKPNARD